MRGKSVFAVVLAVCLQWCVGCGQNVSVTGKVTFEDGVPLSRGEVIFLNGKIQSAAPIAEDGSYSVGTLKPGDGIPRGTYQVYLTKADQPGSISPTGGMLSPPVKLVDSRFMSPDTSDLTCEVNGNMTYDITVARP